jgi:hypothetical protein
MKHPISKDIFHNLYIHDDEILVTDPILSQMFHRHDINNTIICFNYAPSPSLSLESSQWEQQYSVYLDLYKLHILNKLVQKYKPS